MLPPDTEVMWLTCGRMPASKRKRTRPRWYRVARNPPPERASPIFLPVIAAWCAGRRGPRMGLWSYAGDSAVLAQVLDHLAVVGQAARIGELDFTAELGHVADGGNDRLLQSR